MCAQRLRVGRVLLAGLSPDRLEHYFNTTKLEALTDKTVCDPTALRVLIDCCRSDGYAVVADELAYGVVALAVPVLDQSGRTVAALNSSSHSGKITRSRLVRDRLGMLQQLSRRISADLRAIPGLSLSAQT